MRVISQDSGFDVPYENSSLSLISANICGVGCANIYCYNSSVDKAIKMAQYSTEEKAKKAMKILRLAYENNEFYHHIANSEHFVEICNMLSKEEYKKSTSEYFQFPAEEELE